MKEDSFNNFLSNANAVGKTIVACEASQTITIALRTIGVEAYSCDILPCYGGYPEWHIQGDAIKEVYSGKYKNMIGHPPCDFMSNAGAKWMYPTAGNIDLERYAKALKAKEFFLMLWNAPIENICLENPTPLRVVELPKPTQVIQPYEFGHEYSKRTLLWLKGFPKLEPTNIIKDFKPYLPSNTGGGKRGQKATFVNISKRDSSKTFDGIANAMADQWFLNYLGEEKIIKTAKGQLTLGLNEYLNEQLILHGVVVNGAKEQNSIKKEYLNESDKIAIKNKKDSEMELCDHPSEYARKYGSTEVCEKCGKTWG